MRLIKYIVPLFAALLPLLLGQDAQAGTTFQLDFTLDTPLVAANGAETNLTGHIQNTGLVDFLLNDVQVTLDGDAANYLTVDPFVFFDNVPGLFVVGDPLYKGPIIGITPSEMTPQGFYSGSVTLLGGSDQDARLPLASARFQIQAVNAPEPSAAALILTGLAFYRRRTRRHNA